MEEIEKVKAGFWIRFAAMVIDLILIYFATSIIVIIAQYLNYYIPFELSFLILATFYSAISLGMKNATIGMVFCGLVVLQKDDAPIGYLKASIREFIGKLTIIILLPYVLAALILRGNNKDMAMAFLPLFIIIILLIIFLIQYLITKRAWFDYISQTFVYQNIQSKGRNKYFILASIILIVSLLGNEIMRFKSKSDIASYYATYALAKPDYGKRDIIRPEEVSSLDSTKIGPYVNWLNNYGKSPKEYILDEVSQHQVTIFGEVHNVSNYLKLLNELIPDLYYKAGVRCIAMEVCVHEDDELIEKLITSKEYDNKLALEIGRDEPWTDWGEKEYWDILKAVWALNKSLKPGQDKMEIIGLDSKWDGPSIALTRGTDEGKSGSILEMLRVFRAINSFPLVIYRDELMAYEIEKQIIDKNLRGIVWVGAGHSYLNCKPHNQIKGRMGYILYKKYGNKIFQINTHNSETSEPIAHWIEKCVAKSNFKQVGFDLFKSPFNELRDSSSDLFHNMPNVDLGDLTRGYIYLVPCDSLKPDKFISNFITPKMFATEKPYYELRWGRSFTDAKAVNEYYINNIEK